MHVCLGVGRFDVSANVVKSPCLTMKLRARLHKTTKVISLSPEGQEPTLCMLRDAISAAFQRDREDTKLSLNGKDELAGSDNTTLADLGLVTGDLVRILTPEASVQAMSSAGKTEATSSTSHESGACGKSSAVKSESAQPQRFSDKMEVESEGQNRRDEEKMDQGKDISDLSEVATTSADMGTNNAAPGSVDSFENDPEAIRDSQVNRYLNEPALVRDSTETVVPQVLQQVYRTAGIDSSNDALCAVLHVLMLESGFQIKEESNIDLSDHNATIRMPDGWNARSTAVYNFAYQLPGFLEFPACLICIPMGTLIIVHGKVGTGTVRRQLKLKSTDYVKPDMKENAAQTYKNLSKLSRLFKDEVAYPLVQEVKEECGYSPTEGFSGLITELKLMIMKYLKVGALLQMSQVCKELCGLCKEPVLWRRLYLIDFGRRPNNDISQDWKAFYRQKYENRKRIREQMRLITPVVPPFMGHPHPPLPFAPVYPPGVIGGDYDLNPDFQGIGGPFGGTGPMPGAFVPRPRFDPLGPVPMGPFRPGRGGGLRDGGRPYRPGFGSMGPRFF